MPIASHGCPLCRRSPCEVLEQIPVSRLVRCYERVYGIDVGPEFNGRDTIHYCHCPECDLRFFSPACPGSELFYNALQTFTWYYLSDKAEFTFASSWISPTDAVLEIGCGKGAFASHIATNTYTGLELSRPAAQAASELNLNVLCETIDKHAACHPGAYDVVCAFQVLEHVDPVNSFIADSLKCLRPGGLLIYCVPSLDSYLQFLCNPLLNLPPHHVTHWPDTALKYVSEIYPVKVIQIHHELLAPIHKSAYGFAVTLNALNGLLKRKQKILDVSFGQTLLTRLATLLARIYVSGLRDESLLPRGHSVTVVYKKSSGAVE